ncbi:MAG: (2Fe-2S)-binding protein [Deltaproteobacteria bacterium]|nr:(2Fe-2S)-binding protein [Deltaproteobacteria bacterium]
MIKLTIDNREIEAGEGMTLLRACLENDIYIPNLCYLKDRETPFASCRLCFVEIEGEDSPVASCTVKIKDGMVITTDSSTVRQLQRTALQLLLSVHDVDCANCPANKRCALQDMAKFLKVGLKPKQLPRHLKEIEIDETHPYLNYYPNRCVLCGKCVFVCKDKEEQPSLAFAKRGLDTVIVSYAEQDISSLPCKNCLACVEICPVGAIVLKDRS